MFEDENVNSFVGELSYTRADKQMVAPGFPHTSTSLKVSRCYCWEPAPTEKSMWQRRHRGGPQGQLSVEARPPVIARIFVNHLGRRPPVRWRTVPRHFVFWRAHPRPLPILWRGGGQIPPTLSKKQPKSNWKVCFESSLTFLRSQGEDHFNQRHCVRKPLRPKTKKLLIAKCTHGGI